MEPSGVYVFGPFRLNEASGILYRDEAVVPLAQKAAKILRILVGNGGHLVNREDLIRQVWAETYVEDANLTYQIAILRRTLGKDAGGSGFIETFAKRGYRFSGDVRRVEELTPNPAPRDSLAVLPLLNMSPDGDTEYFSDGLTEEITTALVRAGGLHIAARTSAFQFRAAARDIREIGVRLNVRTVLEGSVRKAGDRLRITLQLIDAENGYHLWSEVYDRQVRDVFAIQEEIAGAITMKIKGKTHGGDPLRRTCYIEAYHLYLKGRFVRNHTNLNGFAKSIEYYRQALEHDPSYAPAYAGLAESYINLAWPFSFMAPRDAYAPAKAAASQALRLDDGLADAHVAMGMTKLHFEWDLAGAEAAFRRAVALDPEHANGHHRYSHCLVAMNRMDESLVESMRCLALDPLDATMAHHPGWHYRMARDFEGAIHQHEKVLRLEPARELTRIFLGQALIGQGRYREAREAYETAFKLGRGGPGDLAWQAHADALYGPREQAIGNLEQMIRERERSYVSAVGIARVYVALGDVESALQWLRQAVEDRDPNLAYAAVDPDLAPLADNECFKALLRDAGLAGREDSVSP